MPNSFLDGLTIPTHSSTNPSKISLGLNDDNEEHLNLLHDGTNAHLNNFTGNIVAKLSTNDANSSFQITNLDGNTIFKVDAAGTLKVAHTDSNTETNTVIDDKLIESAHGTRSKEILVL